MKNQVIYVSPSIEEARVRLFNFLFDFEKVVANQKRLEYTINSVISCFFFITINPHSVYHIIIWILQSNPLNNPSWANKESPLLPHDTLNEGLRLFILIFELKF